jgi:amino acid permease
MGLIPAFFSCIFAGACSAFGLYLLSLCARQVGRPTNQPSTAFCSSGPNTPAKQPPLGSRRVNQIESGSDEDEADDPDVGDVSFARTVTSRRSIPITIKGYEKPEASFNQIARLTFGEGWATRCFDAAIAIKCFGVSVSYLIIVKVSVAISSRREARMTEGIDRDDR